MDEQDRYRLRQHPAAAGSGAQASTWRTTQDKLLVTALFLARQNLRAGDVASNVAPGAPAELLRLSKQRQVQACNIYQSVLHFRHILQPV